MAAEHFEAHPDGLRELAADFGGAADDIQARSRNFAGQVLEIGEAFGILGACEGVTLQYAEMVAHTREGLGHLSEVLDHSGSGLKQSADHYDAVERHTIKTMGG